MAVAERTGEGGGGDREDKEPEEWGLTGNSEQTVVYCKWWEAMGRFGADK